MSIKTGLKRNYVNIGIVLPEDAIKTIDVSWNKDIDVKKSFESKGNSVSLKVDNGKIALLLDGEIKDIREEVTIETNDSLEVLHPQYGVKLFPVIAGRGFHWQRDIEVFLPGVVTFSVVDGNLFVKNRVALEAYVVCVATSEMGAEAPDALLAAQTIVARCYVLANAEKKFESLGIDYCNDDESQRYQGTTYLSDHSVKAARETENQAVVYENEVIDARYSKNCGGIAEEAAYVWGEDDIPYLTSFWDGPDHPEGFAENDMDKLLAYEDAYCSHKRFENVNLAGMLGKVDVSGEYYRWNMEIPKKVILEKLKTVYDLEWDDVTGIEILTRGKSGRIGQLKLTGMQNGNEDSITLPSEYRIRQVLHESFLYSSAFVIMNNDTFENDENLLVKGSGWGHGSGLCQMGALGMALEGFSYEDILKHYYPGTSLVTYNPSELSE